MDEHTSHTPPPAAAQVLARIERALARLEQAAARRPAPPQPAPAQPAPAQPAATDSAQAEKLRQAVSGALSKLEGLIALAEAGQAGETLHQGAGQ